jgi:2-oxoglutarate dehydrogenase E2 component (dihydrolipoamide succinyltransferase)
MNIPIVMPQMGQSVAEGIIVRWRKRVGDEVAVDEPLLDIESDKINVEVGSPAAGRLMSCLKAEGETASVGEVIGLLDGEGEAGATDDVLPAAAAGSHRPHAGSSGDQVLVSARSAAPAQGLGRLPDITRDWLSPYVMRLALQNNLAMTELRSIRGTGRDGRLTRNDVLQYLARRPVGSTSLPVGNGAETDPAALAHLGEVVPMTSIRRTIADHMVQSIHTSAHVTMVHAVDMTSIVALREKAKDAFAAAYGVKMTYTAVILFALSRVLRDYPIINASVSGPNIVMRKEINIGCAVALPDESLVVPVVRRADGRTFPAIAQELERLIRLSRDKALRREDVEDGTFTLSNFGAFGSLIGTPIINQPQVAILGMGAIYKAPVVVDGAICIRDQVYLSFTFDHRVIDGAMGGRFLNAIQKTIESLSALDLDLILPD